jgi:hypothetical protein
VSPTGRVGGLRMDKSTPADIRRFAGAPAFSGRGATSANFSDLVPRYTALGYACSRQQAGFDPGGARPAHLSCRTVYFVNPKTGKLAGFWTNSAAFRTNKGSRPGMRQGVADRLEGAHPYVPRVDRDRPRDARGVAVHRECGLQARRKSQRESLPGRIRHRADPGRTAPGWTLGGWHPRVTRGRTCEGVTRRAGTAAGPARPSAVRGGHVTRAGGPALG